MENSQATNPRSAKAAMLIRKPVHEVFEAFINPEITTKFWFTKSSGRLDSGKQVKWEWEMYNVSAQVIVQSIAVDKHIRIRWAGDEDPTAVEWTFTPYGDDKTFVTITNSGFTGEGDELIEQLVGATEAWTLVLAGLKALLEYNVRLGLVGDRFPEGI
jgi:uncharacterized protein YndB with AHSA1/START domain